MTQNPTTAIDAILETDRRVGSLTVRPLTLARMALLELVHSPFVDTEQKFTYANMVPSAFVVCAPSSELKGYTSKNIEQMVEKSYEWADGIEPVQLTKVVETVLGDLAEIYRISPSTGSAESAESAESKGN